MQTLSLEHPEPVKDGRRKPSETEIEAVLCEFERFCKVQSKKQIRQSTLDGYTACLRVLIQKCGLPLHRLDVPTLRAVVASRLTSNLSRFANPGDLSNTTMNRFLFVLRRFAELRGIDTDRKEVKRTLAFKTATPRRPFGEESLLTPENVETLIGCMKSAKWKCLFAVLWDTGGRVDEICSLDFSDVHRDANGFVVNIRHSKTVSRALRILTPIGLRWLTLYLPTHSGVGPLFSTRSGKKMNTNTVRQELRRAENSVGKHVSPVSFRKSASTLWKKTGLPSDPAIRMRLGHAKDSRMFEKFYLTFGAAAYREEELRALGVSEKPSEPEEAAPHMLAMRQTNVEGSAMPGLLRSAEWSSQ